MGQNAARNYLDAGHDQIPDEEEGVDSIAEEFVQANEGFRTPGEKEKD